MPVGARNQDGSASLVTVLTLPVTLFALLLIIQTALYFHGRNVAEAAAQEGASVARRFDGTDAAAKQSVASFLDGSAGAFAVSSVQVRRDANTATVVVEGLVPRLIPFLPLRVRGSAAGPVERFVEPAQFSGSGR